MTRCSFCVFVWQLIANIALLIDHALNTVLLGDPNETVSRRTARARMVGKRWARVLCRAYQFVFGGHGAEDHCTWALNNSEPSVGRELLDWNTGKIEAGRQ